MADEQTDQEREQDEANKNAFKTFLENEDGDYFDKVRALIDSKKQRVMVNLHDLRAYDPALANDVINKPLKHILPFQEGLGEVVESMDPTEYQKFGHSRILKVRTPQILGPELGQNWKTYF